MTRSRITFKLVLNLEARSLVSRKRTGRRGRRERERSGERRGKKGRRKVKEREMMQGEEKGRERR